MPLFSEFIADLATRRSLRRNLDGGRVTYRIQLSGSTIVTIQTDETRSDLPSKVYSEGWPTPPTDGAHDEFMRQALNFNRNALHHLPCGILRDAEMGNDYRLIWTIPPVERNTSEWTEQLLLFGKLAEKAWATLASPIRWSDSRAASGDSGHMIFMP